jgi:uncharacterized membrane protein
VSLACRLDHREASVVAAVAADTEERARLAVDDLERAGGFDRAHLLVTTTTGTGWLDPGSMAAFEYVAGGDSAIVGLQYSFLPSWISYLVDQPRAREAGRALFDAVYERWIELPQGDRPELYVTGESLGSFGMEAAFSGEADLRIRTDGAPPAHHRSTRCTASSPTTAIRAAPRSSRSTATGAPCGSSAVSSAPSDRPISPGRAPGSCTCSTPPIRSCGGGATCALTAGLAARASRSVDAWATLLRPDGWTDADADRLKVLVAPDD